MTIRAQVIGSLSLVIAVSLLGAALIVYIQRQDAALAAEALRTGRVLQVHADLSRALTELKVERRMAVLTRTATSTPRTHALETSARGLFAELESVVVNPQQRLLLERLQTQYRSWGALPSPSLSEVTQASVDRVFHDTNEAFALLEATLDDFTAHQRVLSASAQRNSGEFRRWAQIAFLTIALVIALTSGALLVMLRRSVLKPLAALTATAASITRGEVPRITAVAAGNEVALLTNTLSQMLATINAREQEIRARNEELGDNVIALRAVDRMKDEFVAVVSHELRTPLTAIRAALQLVLDDPSYITRPAERELLQVALNNCERLTRITNDILDISKIEAGHMTLDRMPVAVADLVALARQSVEQLARSTRVQMETRISGQPRRAVVVDRDRIVQALVNILSNAVKFAPPDSMVTIEVDETPGEVSIAVTDQGIGIAESDLARVFDKFQQADSSASRRKGGTGLGLAITRALVEQHGGRVDATSVVGRGARFVIVLPLPASGVVEGRANS